MADKKISDFTEAVTLDNNDLVEIETTGGNSRKIKASLIRGPVKIEEQALSAVSSFSLEALSGGAYKRIEIELEGQFSTDASHLIGTFKLNGAYKTAANYKRAIAVRSSGGSTDSNNSAGAANFTFPHTGATWGVGNAAGEYLSVKFIMINPYNTSRNKSLVAIGSYIAPSGALVGITDACIMYDGTDATAALEGIDFDTNAGTFTGNVIVRGWY